MVALGGWVLYIDQRSQLTDLRRAGSSQGPQLFKNVLFFFENSRNFTKIEVKVSRFWLIGSGSFCFDNFTFWFCFITGHFRHINSFTHIRHSRTFEDDSLIDNMSHYESNESYESSQMIESDEREFNTKNRYHNKWKSFSDNEESGISLGISGASNRKSNRKSRDNIKFVFLENLSTSSPGLSNSASYASDSRYSIRWLIHDS